MSRDDRNEMALAIGKPSVEFANSLKFEKVVQAPINLKKQHREYGALFASMQLQLVAPSKLQKTIKRWYEAVIPGGQVHIVVPSFEWAAEQCYEAKPSPALSVHILGDETMQYKSLWTMRALRGILHSMNIPVVGARQVTYVIAEKFPARALYVIAQKPEEK